MSTFKTSSNLKTLQASTTKSVAFATSSKSNPTESLPDEQRWWTNKFRLGPRALLTKKKSTSSTSATFQTPTAGSAHISHVTFAPNAIKGHPYQMAIVSGPRVCLYGGTVTSSLARALARTKPGEEEEPTSLFGTEDKSVKPDRTVALGGQPAHHVAYHRDGRLLIVGCDYGIIKICDGQSRATLRTFTTHAEKGGFAIRSVGWIPETKKGQKMIWSAGDDAILRVWDLSGDFGGIGDRVKPVVSMKGHGDAIRCTAAYKVGERGDQKIRLVTGSYDHTIRVWDCDSLKVGMMGYSDDDRDRCLSVMDHGSPVECLVVVNPSATSAFKTPVILSAGGTTVKLWDPQLGTCLSTIQTKHSKTITSICITSMIRGDKDEFDGDGKKIVVMRLITAGLDGLIRIHSADELYNSDISKEKQSTNEIALPYLHGVKTSLPITALAMSPDSTRLVVGTSTGYVTVRQRAKYVPQGVKRKSAYEPKAGTYSFFTRGASADADADDHVVMLQKKKKLRKYDTMLQKFRYGDALDEALASRDPKAVSMNAASFYPFFHFKV
jgi:U3 small nucleolar RNA-associated protein 15